MTNFTNHDVLAACANDASHWDCTHSGPIADALATEVQSMLGKRSLVDRAFQNSALSIQQGPMLVSLGTSNTFNVCLNPVLEKRRNSEFPRDLPYMRLSSVLEFRREEAQSLEDKLLQAVGDLNTAADRLWREMVGLYAQHVEIDSTEDIVRALVRTAGRADVSYFVGADLAADLTTRIRRSAVASEEERLQGIVGYQEGSTIFTDAVAPPEHRVLQPLEMIRIQGAAVGATCTTPVVCSHIIKRDEGQVDIELSKMRQIFVFPNQSSITIYS